MYVLAIVDSELYICRNLPLISNPLRDLFQPRSSLQIVADPVVMDWLSFHHRQRQLRPLTISMSRQWVSVRSLSD